MAEPSEYELQAWRGLDELRRRRVLSRVAESVGDVVNGAAHAGAAAVSRAVQDSPRLREAADAVSRGVRSAGTHTPEPVKAAGQRTASAVLRLVEAGVRTVHRAATAPLKPEKVIKAHAAAGHEASCLSDLRRLDLAAIDEVKPRSLDLTYAAAAAAVGMGSGFALTGGQVAIVPSPAMGVGAVAGAVAVDAAALVTLASAVAAHTGMYYGYDPARPEEKVFALAVINWANAGTLATKSAAWKDLRKVAWLLRRNESWVKLNETVTATIAGKFADKFSANLYKRSLGKFVPVAAIAAGGALNWVSLETTADAADLAFRRRFLLDKYPQLLNEVDVAGNPQNGTSDDTSAEPSNEEPISVVQLLQEEGAIVEAESSPEPRNSPPD